MNRLISMVVALVAIVALTAPVAAAQRPIALDFVKSGAEGVYAGTITSAGGGTLAMELTHSELHGNTQHFTAEVQVAGSAAGSFTAVVSGQINFSTLRVFLNGTVTDGALEGARVREESQLTGMDPVTGVLTFSGTITIMPAS